MTQTRARKPFSPHIASPIDPRWVTAMLVAPADFLEPQNSVGPRRPLDVRFDSDCLQLIEQDRIDPSALADLPALADGRLPLRHVQFSALLPDESVHGGMAPVAA